jgi:hypothetical protein
MENKVTAEHLTGCNQPYTTPCMQVLTSFEPLRLELCLLNVLMNVTLGTKRSRWSYSTGLVNLQQEHRRSLLYSSSVSHFTVHTLCTHSRDAGNPAVLNYYVPFLHHLHAILPSTHAILATSHVGHSITIPAPSSPLDLLQHLETKVEFVLDLQSYLNDWAQEDGVGKPDLVLMGHSVGAWLTCEVMKRVKGVHAGYLLFPALGWIADSWNGWLLWVCSLL